MANETLRTSLDPACIRLELNASGRNEAISELIRLIHAKHCLQRMEEAISAVTEREQKMSTSLGNGIAVPHGKIESIEQLLVAVGVKQKGIDFQSADDQPAKIIILILSPKSQSGPHIRCLAEIGRLLQSEANRTKILAAKDVDTLYRILTDPGN